MFFFQATSYGQVEPSTSFTNFTNQITKVNSLLEEIDRHLSESKIDSASILLKELPNEISGFSFLYQADATSLKENHNVELNVLNIQIKELNSKIQNLDEQNKGLKSEAKEELVKFIEEFLAKKDLSDKKVERLETENENLVNERLKLTEKKTVAEAEIIRLNDSIKVLKSDNIELKNSLKSIYSSVKMGLSVGFNGFVNNQLDYMVRSDSTVRESGIHYGVSGIISAVVSISLDSLNKNNIIINLPLGDFTSSPSQAMGLFNQRVAVGLGYARSISKVSPNLLLSASFNISPYEQIDYSEIEGKKIDLLEYTKLKPEDYGSTTAYSYSLTIGFVYTFNSNKK